jgi:hypothetical protein
MIAVTYPSLFGTTPDRKIETWDELVGLLSDHRENSEKERAPLWSPVTLVPGGTRKNAAVAQVNALVFDVDGGTAYATAKAALADREWIAYSTFSHTPEEERFHLVVRLDESVAGEAWARTYDELRKGFGFGDVLRAPCHSYFLPQHRKGAEYFVEVNR